MQSLPRVLIVNPFGIGDVLFSMPLLAALKERVPGGFIGYLGNARTAPVLRNDPRINRVFTYERDEFVAVYRRSPWAFFQKWRGLVNEIAAQKFDLAFDLSLGSPVAAALFFAGIPRRIGYDYKGRGRWLTDKLPLSGYEGRHVAEYYLDLLPRAGWPAENPDERVYSMPIFPSQDDAGFARQFLRERKLETGKYFVIYPGGGASWGNAAFQKRWPLENYARLADKVVEKCPSAIILMGDNGERELCALVAGAMKSAAINAAGLTSVTQAAAIMRGARFVLANDGGPLHIAAACGARTLSVFGPVDPVVYGAFPRSGHRVVQKGLPCQPCYRRFRMSDCGHLSCLRTLGVDEVFNQLREYL